MRPSFRSMRLTLDTLLSPPYYHGVVQPGACSQPLPGNFRKAILVGCLGCVGVGWACASVSVGRVEEGSGR